MRTYKASVVHTKASCIPTAHPFTIQFAIPRHRLTGQFISVDNHLYAIGYDRISKLQVQK